MRATVLDQTVATLVDSHANADQVTFDDAVATLAEIVQLSPHSRPASQLLSPETVVNRCACGREFDSSESRSAHQNHCVTFKLAALDAIEASLADHDEQVAGDQPWWQT